MTKRDVSENLHPVLVRFVEKLLASLGDVAQRERTGHRAAPIVAWCGRDVIDFVRDLRQSTFDDYMGIGAAPCALGANDFLIDLGTRCATLREAVTMGIRFMGMATSAVHFRIIEEKDCAVIEITQEPSAQDPDGAITDWSMIVWHKLCQWLIGAEIWLDRTEFNHSLDTSYSSYVEMFGGECVFNLETSRLIFNKSYLELPVIRTRSEADWLKSSAPGWFARPIGLAKPWKQQIKDIFRLEIERGLSLSTLESLAARFGISSQTLRRRLRDEQASYRDLKARARLESAVDVLANGVHTVGEASAAAGFAESNALTRALRASNGITSSQLREQIKHWSARDIQRTGRPLVTSRPNIVS